MYKLTEVSRDAGGELAVPIVEIALFIEWRRIAYWACAGKCE